jgi:hypothetical protein
VKDAAGALDGSPDGGRVEEVHLEQPEARGRAIQGLQVLRLALVLCKNSPPAGTSKIQDQDHKGVGSKRKKSS